MTTAMKNQSEPVSEIRRYALVLRKRLWVILTFFSVVAIATTIGTMMQTPIYRATSTVLIEREAPNVVSFQEVVALGTGNYYDTKSYYETQFKIIRSRSIAADVINNLKLDRKPPLSKAADPVKSFLGGLFVDPIKNSHLVSISYEHKDPQAASLIANAISETYREKNISTKRDVNIEAIKWLKDESEMLESKVMNAELALQQFKEENDIISFEERQNIVSQSILELSTELAKARHSRIQAESLHKMVRDYAKSKEKSNSIPSVLSNNMIQGLKSQKIELEREKAELKKRYKSSHPQMQKVDAQIELLQDRIDMEIQRIVKGIETEYVVARDQENALAREMERMKVDKRELDKKWIKFSAMEREAESSRSLYDVLQKRTKETEITKSLAVNNIHIIDKAEVPKNPVRPRKRLNVALGLILGLFGGIGLAFFFEIVDNTVKTREDVENILQLPFLGIIPSLDNEEDDAAQAHLFSFQYPKSSVAENCRVIRTNITFSSFDRKLKKLLVTSAGPQEGKSTTVINLGIVFAQDDKKVLIIDSDLRRPRLHKAFDVSKGAPGISNLVMGESTLDEVIYQTEIPNLSIIPCGPVPPSPAELLGSTKLEKLLDPLAGRYDWILFDSPPVVAVTDAVVLSRLVDGVILVVKAGKTTKDLVGKARMQLQDAGIPVLGTVLNDFDVHSEGYRYYSYYHTYQGKEGETGKIKKRRRKKPEENTNA